MNRVAGVGSNRAMPASDTDPPKPGSSAGGRYRRVERSHLLGLIADGLDHDLRSGLTSVSLVLEALAPGLGQQERQMAQRARSALRTLRQRTGQIQWLTAAGQREQRAVDAAFLLEIAARLVRDQWPTVEVELDHEMGSPPVVGRPMNLLRALCESAAALAEATVSGPMRLALSGAARAESGDPVQLDLSVPDVTWSQLDRQRLQAVSRALSASGGSLVRRDENDAAHIRIRLESGRKPGTGASIERLEAPGDGVDPASGNRVSLGTSGQPQLVVLAEDDEGTRTMLRAILQRQGCRVLDCGDGETALRHLREAQHVDLLVSDLFMPGVTGASLIRRARELHPNVPIVAMSGEAAGFRQLESAELRVQACLTKPFPGIQLAGIVEKLLKEGRPTR